MIGKKGRGKGILALATGAGKTITSIYGAVKIYEHKKPVSCNSSALSGLSRIVA